jgi:hypothetical protein
MVAGQAEAAFHLILPALTEHVFSAVAMKSLPASSSDEVNDASWNS